MSQPLFQRSIRWRLMFVMVGICLLFSVTLTIIHTHAQSDLMRQAMQNALLLKKEMLMEHGRLLSKEIKELAENDIESYRDASFSDVVYDALDRHEDLLFVYLSDSNGVTRVKAVKPGITIPLPLQSGAEVAAAVESSTREYENKDYSIFEFIEPVEFDGHHWGVLRLGLSTASLMHKLEITRSEMSATTDSMIRKSLRFSLLLLLVGVVIILFFSGRLTKPIAELTESVHAFSHGNFTATAGLNLDSDDEVGRLSKAFIKMVNDLQRTYSTMRQTADEARRTGAFLDSILENLPHMIFVKDAKDLKFILMNKAGESMIGLQSDKLIGKNDYDFFPRDQAEFFTRMDREVLRSGKMVDIPEEALTKADGTVRYLHTKKIPVYGLDGIAHFLLGISEDITNLKSAEEERRLFFSHSMDMMCIADFQGYFIQINPAFEKILGYTPEELCSRPFVEFVHPDDLDNTRNAANLLGEGKTIVSFDNRYFCKDGSIRWLTWNATANTDIKKIYAVARDTTEQRKMEEQIVQAGLKEQQRIAHDLHDGLGQILTGLAYKGKLIEQMLNDGELPVPSQAAEIVRLANHASEQARQLARGLDPVVLQEGMVMALNDLAHTTKEVFGITCKVEHDPDCEDIEKSTAIHLYRIAQEAVNNAIKHGKANSISIYLTNDRSAVTLVVMNDGPVVCDDIKQPLGLGIQTMNYRAKMIGGVMAFIPGPAGGLIVRCTVRKQEKSNPMADNRQE